MDDDTDTHDAFQASSDEPSVAPGDASISASITDLHALAAFGEVDSLEHALHIRAASTGDSLAAVVNQPDELGLTLLHAAAQSGQPHVSAATRTARRHYGHTPPQPPPTDQSPLVPAA